jgi:hypothetical protein
MTRVLVLLIAIVLAGCGEDKEVARKRNEQRLPNGCRIIDLDYCDLRAAVVCEGRKTNTSVRLWTETVMVPQFDPVVGTVMLVQQTTYHRHITAEIGSP